MTKPEPSISLTDFAEQVKDNRKGSYCDTLPEEIQEQLLNADVSVEVARKWLRSLGYEATGLEAWRRSKRVERGIQPG